MVRICCLPLKEMSMERLITKYRNFAVMNASPGIVKKIWVCYTILAIGYFFSTLLGFLGGHELSSRLLDVSERQLSLVQKSEMALVTFKEQIHGYANAIITSDGVQIEKASENARKVRGLLGDIAAIKPHADPIYQDIVKTIKDLDAFGNKAESVYTRLSADFKRASADPEVTKAVRTLALQTNVFQKGLNDYAIRFSEDLKLNLAKIRKTNQRQGYWNLFIFIGVAAGTILSLES